MRSILDIKWQDHESNEEVLKRASLPSIESIFVSGADALGWPRLKDGRHARPKKVFCSELKKGRRDRGTPRKRYEEELKEQLAGISH